MLGNHALHPTRVARMLKLAAVMDAVLLNRPLVALTRSVARPPTPNAAQMDAAHPITPFAVPTIAVQPPTENAVVLAAALIRILFVAVDNIAAQVDRIAVEQDYAARYRTVVVVEVLISTLTYLILYFEPQLMKYLLIMNLLRQLLMLKTPN